MKYLAIRKALSWEFFRVIEMDKGQATHSITGKLLPYVFCGRDPRKVWAQATAVCKRMNEEINPNIQTKPLGQAKLTGLKLMGLPSNLSNYDMRMESEIRKSK